MNRAEKRRNKKLAAEAAKKSKPAQVTSPLPAEQLQTLTIQQAIELGVKHHNAGDLPKAEGIYQQILQAEPKQPVVLHLLGVIAGQMGKSDIAVDLIGKALAIKPDFAEAHGNLGLELQELGKLEDAVASYENALAIKPDFAEAHYNLGNVLKKLDKLEDAVASYQNALAITPDFAEAHNNLGLALQTLGKLDDAVSSHQNALAINPGFTEAHNNLGLALQKLGMLDDAVASYQETLAINSDHPEANNNLGAAFQELGKLDDAVASYHKALAIRPDYAEAHNNLGHTLQELGKLGDAFMHHRRAINLEPKNDAFWLGLVASIRPLSFTSIDDNLWQDLLSLVDRPTVRPADIARPITSALEHHTEFSRISELVTTVRVGGSLNYQNIAAQLSEIPLFLRLIALTHLADLKLERMLTFLRRLMLQDTIAGKMKDDGLPFASALALHCFVNEYVFAETDEEILSVKYLQKQISESVEQKKDVPPSFIATLGAYRPLHKFTWAKNLADQEWGNEISTVIERQILEPFIELSLRPQFPRLTLVQETISKSVREQYEENPYPRWIRTNLADKGGSIGAVLKAVPLRFDLGDYQTPNSPEILIAGCGTGQQCLGTVSRYKDARVLAVDLSLSSLSYAERKTSELGIPNIEYAQADIMNLMSLERQFDLIECGGVLHHLGEPFLGWKVLFDLLKPGGLMKIGLYSETGRKNIVAGRSMISKMGYTTSPKDIRQCRQDFIAMAKDGNEAMAKICNTQDFYSLSECRDLLFHVQEHRFTLLQIEDALNALKLKFLGFEIRDPLTIQKFKEIYPNRIDLTSLALWHEFEQQHQDTFSSMYEFWCRKI